jgi:outer membrane receptor for ferrienterochelin and colicin
MKHSKFKISVLALLLSAGISASSCKNKSKDATDDTTTTAPTTTAPAPAPVEISADDSLRNGVTDATKDYPGVTATVNNGEITLTGSLQRSKLQDLMQRLNGLHPKKINNNLKLN